MYRWAILAAAACLAAAALAQETPKPKLSSTDLLEDVAFLRQVYEAAHPGLYRYNTKAEMDGHFAALRAEFSRDRTLAEAYVALSQFLAKVRCGHTYANFFNQKKSIVQALFAGKNRIPFYFRWLGERMIVVRDLSAEKKLKPGMEILAINGISASSILAKMMTIARADGANDAKRIALLEVRGNDKYETFDIFLPFLFPAIGTEMDLLTRQPGSAQTSTLKVTAQDARQRQSLLAENVEPSGKATKPLWKLEQLDDQVVYLRMPSWALYNSKWDWRAFLDSGVDQLIDKQVPALIIDLRGNEGGLDVGDAIIARITPGAIRDHRFQRYTRYRQLPLSKTAAARLSTWDQSFRDWGAAAKEDHDGFFRMTKYDDNAAGTVIAPKGRRYLGRVVVLIDASNSSATFQFAQRIKEQKLAMLVGQPTGGNQRGINGGAFFFVNLPKSKIEVDLPLIATFAGDERPTGKTIPFRSISDAGIEPDVAVVPSIEDIAAGLDSELRAAQALLKRARR